MHIFAMHFVLQGIRSFRGSDTVADTVLKDYEIYLENSRRLASGFAFLGHQSLAAVIKGPFD
jgi:hypothetical protein